MSRTEREHGGVQKVAVDAVVHAEAGHFVALRIQARSESLALVAQRVVLGGDDERAGQVGQRRRDERCEAGVVEIGGRAQVQFDVVDRWPGG